MASEHGFNNLAASDAALCHVMDGQAFINQANSAEITKDTTWVWIYRAPWRWLAEGISSVTEQALNEWKAEQREVLKLRRVLKGNLVLVNADNVSLQHISEKFDLTLNETPLNADTNKKQHVAVVTLLAELFEKNAPDYWDIYEALETIAWLPEGEAEFRGNYEPLGITGLYDLVNLASAAARIPDLMNNLQKKEVEISELVSEREKLRFDLTLKAKEIEAERVKLQIEQEKSKNATEESELILNQLFKVQEELEVKFLENKELKESIQNLQAKIKENADSLTKEQQKAKASGEAVKKSEQKAVQLKKESDLILSQLFSVQGELEAYYLKAKALEQEIAEVQEKNSQQEIQIKKLTADNTVLTNKASENEKATASIVVARNEAQRNIDRLNAEIKKANQSNKEIAVELEKLKKESNALKITVQTKVDSLAHARTNNQVLIDKVKLLEGKLDSANKKQDNLVQQINLTKKELSDAKSLNAQAFEVIEDSRKTFERARKFIGQMVTVG